MNYADLHCDTLTCGSPSKYFLHKNSCQVSLEKLMNGHCILQCFSIFVPSTQSNGWEKTVQYINAYRQVEEKMNSKGIKPVLTIEDGGNADTLERVEKLILYNVQFYGITWNNENILGSPCGTNKGLKTYGKKVVNLLCERNVYPDLSHLSDKGIDDVIEIAKEYNMPVVATHSLCRSVHCHKRNLSDNHIRKIANSGGLVGINFVKEFIGEDKSIINHILHLIEVGGEDILAIGTDFDGVKDPLIQNAAKMPRFLNDLEKEGVSNLIIEKLAYKNLQRLIKF